MTIDFHPEAKNEFLASIKYYNQKAAGLGDQFYDKVQTALALLRSFPEIGSPFEASIRKFPSPVFLLPWFISTKKKIII